MKINNIGALIPSVFIVAAALAQDARPITTEEAAVFFNGKPMTHDISFPMSVVSVSVTFAEDGSASIIGPRGYDTGQYTIEGNRHCVKWKFRYVDNCGQLMKDTDGTVRKIREDGPVEVWRLN